MRTVACPTFVRVRGPLKNENADDHASPADRTLEMPRRTTRRAKRANRALYCPARHLQRRPRGTNRVRSAPVFRVRVRGVPGVGATPRAHPLASFFPNPRIVKSVHAGLTPVTKNGKPNPLSVRGGFVLANLTFRIACDFARFAPRAQRPPAGSARDDRPPVRGPVTRAASPPDPRSDADARDHRY
jgi:hypothetical protein